jgi:hypothetical protein
LKLHHGGKVLTNRLGNRIEGVVEEAHERYNIRSRSERIS